MDEPTKTGISVGEILFLLAIVFVGLPALAFCIIPAIIGSQT